MSRPKKAVEAKSPQDLVPIEDKTGEGKSESSRKYNDVVKLAKLEFILLVASNFKMQPSFVGRERRTDDKRAKLSYGSVADSLTFSSDEGIAGCVWKWNVAGRIKNRKALTIEAHYSIYYSGLADCDEEAVERFLKRVGRFATYPYFRTHVSQISWESGADLPILPIIST